MAGPLQAPVRKSYRVRAGASLADPASVDLDQMELSALCDGLRRYLQDLPQPIVPTAAYAQLLHTAKGERDPSPFSARHKTLTSCPTA